MTKTWDEVWGFRQQLYMFYADCLLEPIQEANKEILTEQFWRQFPLEGANGQIMWGLEQLIQCTIKLSSMSEEKAMETVNVEYTELFIGPPIPKAPPWESFYNTRKKLFFGPTAFIMKDLLKQQGFASARSGSHPEDHLGIELLYLTILTEKMYEATLEEQMERINDQLMFMDDHLLSWIPKLYEDANKGGSFGFYSGLIELIWGTLLWDKELLQEFLEEHKTMTVTVDNN